MSVTETFGRFNASDPIGLQPTLFLCPILFISPLLPNTQTNERTKEKKKKKKENKKKTNDVISYFRHEWLQWMWSSSWSNRTKKTFVLSPPSSRTNGRTTILFLCVCVFTKEPPTRFPVGSGRPLPPFCRDVHSCPAKTDRLFSSIQMADTHDTVGREPTSHCKQVRFNWIPLKARLSWRLFKITNIMPDWIS